jgi:hypothetical protein
MFKQKNRVFLYEMESIQNSISDISKLFLKCVSLNVLNYIFKQILIKKTYRNQVFIYIQLIA